MARQRPIATMWVLMLLSLAGCADRLVDLPTDRKPAPIQALIPGPTRCPAATVAYPDDEAESGAGAVPVGFAGNTVLRCQVDYAQMRVDGSRHRFTVYQWSDTVTAELIAALNLSDRGYRPARGCAAGSSSTTAIYLVDADQAVRVLPPVDNPCSVIRPEVEGLLPDNQQPAEAVFTASRRAP